MSRYEEIKEMLNKTGWYGPTLELVIRAKFKYEYYGKDFLDSTDTYYEFQIDHIIPKKIIQDDRPENLAIACKSCNFIKEHLIPGKILLQKIIGKN